MRENGKDDRDEIKRIRRGTEDTPTPKKKKWKKRTTKNVRQRTRQNEGK